MEKFNSCAESLNWQYSASIVGLIKYFEFFEIPYEITKDEIYYNKDEITLERYLEFVEDYFREDMHHKVVENELKTKSEFTDEEIKFINEKLKANTVMKKYFSKIKFNGTNNDSILNIIDNNRTELIKETYRLKTNLYSNFANPNLFYSDEKNISRLNGFYVDGPKKGKALSYNFDTSTFVGKDDMIFDFIPFAFTIGRDVLFVNDNSDIKELVKTQEMLWDNVKNAYEGDNGRKNVRQAFFKAIIEAGDFIDFDVEVIHKNREDSFFETLFVRKQSIKILKKMGSRAYKYFCFMYKINEKYYLDIQKEVVDAILNLTNVTELIKILLRDDNSSERYKYCSIINNLINVNVLISGRDELMSSVEKAKKAAWAITKKFSLKEENKLKSYKTKLSSALMFKDYRRFCDILINLGNYKEESFNFAYDLFENFEENESVAYAFVNGLGNRYEKNENNEEVK